MQAAVCRTFHRQIIDLPGPIEIVYRTAESLLNDLPLFFAQNICSSFNGDRANADLLPLEKELGKQRERRRVTNDMARLPANQHVCELLHLGQRQRECVAHSKLPD